MASTFINLPFEQVTGPVEVVVDATLDSIKIKGATGNTMAVNADGSINAAVTGNNFDIRDLTFAADKVDASGSAVTVSSSALPLGAATEAKQDTGNTSLASIDAKVATAAKQDTANTSLASIDAKLTAPISVAQSGSWTTDRTWALSSGTDSVAAVQSGTWTVQQGTPPWSISQATASNLNAQVVGSVASAAADSGNPVKTGGVFSTNLPTITTGQRVNTQTNMFGEHAVVVRNKYAYVTAANATTVKSGAGRIHTIIVTGAGASFTTVTIYDSLTAAGTIIALLKVEGASNASSSQTYLLDAEFSTGLTLNLSATASVTITYQ